jgi:hypothetical protein
LPCLFAASNPPLGKTLEFTRMDPNELLKHAPELVKGGAAVAGALKFTDVIKAMLGPATAEIGERFRDDIRLYRYVRQLQCLKKAEKMAKDAGFTPKAVPIKLLFPLLEGASLEENEDLHTMWAALLANAASPEKVEKVRPGFIAILKQMAPDEASLLKLIADLTDGYGSFLRPLKAPSKQALDRAIAAHKVIQMERLRANFRREEEDESAMDFRLQTCVHLLDNAGLIEVGDDIITLSALGRTFLESCYPPNSTS